MRHTALALLLGLTALVSHAEAAGPWRGQIVDAETGQPLDGVVVLAFWTLSEPSLGGWGSTRYHASEEVVTGPDGRFTIASRWSFTVPLLFKIRGPDWRFFKAGYGGWPGEGGWPYVAPGDRERFADGERIVLKLVPLKTRAERLDTITGATSASIVPPENKRRLLDAINAEAESLGLPRQGR